MAFLEGDSGAELASARATLTVRAAELAEADRVLAAVVASAHAIAAQSIAHIEAIAADIDAVAAGPPADSPAAAHDRSRLLVAKQREIAAAVNDARAEAEAKTFALQQLTEHYQSR